MKSSSFRLILLLLLPVLACSTSSMGQTGVSINATGTAPDASAILDVSSATKGVLLPRMTTAQRTSFVPTGLSGMTVFDTSTQSYWYWDGVANVWREIPNTSNVIHSLDAAYDATGAGAGRNIIADAGAVNIQGAGGLLVNGVSGIGTSTPDANYALSALKNTNNSVKIAGANMGILVEMNAGAEDGIHSLHTSTANTSAYFAIKGEVTNENGVGYLGYHTTGDRSYGVYGSSGTFAGYFEGNTNVATGNVGIGMASDPLDKLVVAGGRVEFTASTDATGTAGSGVLEIANSLRLDGNEIITNSGTALLINDDNGSNVQFDAGTLFINATTDRVGVGTTNPAAKLEVEFTGRGGILIDGNDTDDTYIEFENGGGSHYIFDDDSDGHALKLESAPTRNIVFNTDGSNERMVVQSDGRVRVNNLADVNSAVVISNPAGVLGKRPLTGNATDVLLGTGVFGPSSAFADHDWYKTNSTSTATAISDWIYTNGNVGINTGSTLATNPLAALHVQSNIYVGDYNAAGFFNSNANIHVARTNNPHILLEDIGDNTAGISVSSSGLNLVTENGDLNFRTGVTYNGSFSTTGTSRMIVKNNGNVGIGTTTPYANLNVNSTSGPSIYLTREAGTINADDVLGSLLFDGTAQTTASTVDASAVIRAFASQGLGNSNKGGYLTFMTKNNVGAATAATERMRIAADGNVGIGNNAPASIFHVSTSQTGNVSKLHNPSLGNGSLVGHEFGKANSTNNMAEFRYNHVSDGNASNYVNLGLWGSANTLTVAGSGNVGIGTTAAAQKLHVVGNTRISGLAGAGDRMVYANTNGDLVASASVVNANSLVDGAGTLNYLARWTPDGNSLGNGATQDNGTDVGIGIAPGTYKLNVNGTTQSSVYYVNHGGGNVLEVGDDAWISDVNSANTMGVYGQQNAAHGGIRLGSNAGAYLYSNGTANIGVGTTTPELKLDVNGDIHLGSSTGNKQIYTWAAADANWRIGMSASPGFTRSLATTHVQYLTYSTGSTQGFAVGVNGGNSSFEIRGSNHQAYFRGNVGINNTTASMKLHVGAGNGDGILIGNYNDQMGWNGTGAAPETSLRFAGYRDVVSNFTGAKIAATRTNICCSGLSQGTQLDFSVQEGTATSGGDANLTQRLTVGAGGAQVFGYLRVGNPGTPSVPHNMMQLYSHQFASGDGGWTRGNPASCANTQQWVQWSQFDGNGTWLTSALRWDNEIANNADAAFSPWIWIPLNSSPKVSAELFVDIENNFDGGYIEYSTNGSTWTKVTSFTLNGYPDNASLTGCVGGNQSSWNGNLSRMLVRFNLGLSSTWVRFRFIAACDGSNSSGYGIYVYGFSVEATSSSSVSTSYQDGNIYAERNVFAGSNVLRGDVAEYLAVDTKTEPGMLISVKPGFADQYTIASGKGSNQVIGIHSTAPTVLLNNPDQGVPVAMAGRVPVLVNNETGAIKIGDFLMLSSTQGVGCKASSSGFVIGRALENYDSKNVGSIMCLVQNGFYQQEPRLNFSSALGSFVSPKSSERIVVYDNAISSESKIFMTFRGRVGSENWVSEIGAGFFVVSFSNPIEQDVPFDYLVENSVASPIMLDRGVAIVDNDSFDQIARNQDSKKTTEYRASEEMQAIMSQGRSVETPLAEIAHELPPAPLNPNSSSVWTAEKGFMQSDNSEENR